MNRNIVYRQGLPEDLTPDQVDANFRALDQSLKDMEKGRDQVVATTEQLAVGATAYLDADMGKAYALLAMSTDSPARVRVYMTAAHRAADAVRTPDQIPSNDHGLVAEVITAAGILAMRFAPTAFGANLENPVTPKAFLAITNRDVVARSITATFTRLPLEF